MIDIERIKSIKGKLSGFIDHHDVAEPTVEEFMIIVDELITIRELKGDQVPYGYVVRCHHDPVGTGTMIKAHELDYYKYRGDYHYTDLFTAPQKPVVLPSPYYGDRHCLDKREVIAAIEAADGIVKDGE
ncbi:MAG: hypothetical protein [Bacteriophage sp.]|nr:MAG: hypothetical protein [Bacteriophage sp.]